MRRTCTAGCASAVSDAARMVRARMTMIPMVRRHMVKSSTIPVCLPWVSSGVHPRVDPGEIGLLAMEETGDGVHQYGVGGSGVETAGFFEGQDPLHPSIALVTGCPQRALAPEYP